MKLKDTIHFNWYKHLFIVLVIGLCVTASAAVTEADILDVLGNLEQMSGFLSRFLRPDFAYIPKLIGPMISTLQMSVTGTALGVLFAVPVAFLGTTVVTGNRLVTSAIRFFLDIVRTIPNLLLAALMVAIVGIGEFTGVMTIAGLPSAWYPSWCMRPLKPLTRDLLRRPCPWAPTRCRLRSGPWRPKS